MDKKQAKVRKVMKEFKSGELKSSSGKKVTNPKQAIAIGLSEAGLSKRMAEGGRLKDVDTDKNPGLAKLPEDVRNKMGYAKKGGMMKESKGMMKKEIAFMKSKGAPKSMIKHEEKEYGMKKGGKAYAKGGSVAASKMGKVVAGGHKAHGEHSVQKKGHTKGKQIVMKKGGKC